MQNDVYRAGGYCAGYAGQRRRLDTLARDGVYYVKKSYVQQKYRETAWIFREAYDYFIRNASEMVAMSPEAESPIWLYEDPLWAKPEAGTHRLQLSIPREELLLFDRRKWNRILNLSYIGTEEEEREFEKRLRRQGVMDSTDVFSKPYYPQMKAEIKKSWRRLFEEIPEEGTEAKNIQGAVWRLKQEWILGIE